MKLRTLTDSEKMDIESVAWWHRIPVGKMDNGVVVYTPGHVDHGPVGGDWPTTRFGMPEDLTGKTVLDVGAWDGFFSFEAERRGALLVVAADIPQEQGGNWGGTAGFTLASQLLDSSVVFMIDSVESLDRHYQACDLSGETDTPPEIVQRVEEVGYDYVLCYGVLYHIKSPIVALEALFNITAPGGTLLLETACLSDRSDEVKWDFRPGHDGDPTNYWYANLEGLIRAIAWAGFPKQNISVVHDMGIRVTIKAVKPDTEPYTSAF